MGMIELDKAPFRALSQALMETGVAGLIGAERHERSGDKRRPRAPGLSTIGNQTSWMLQPWRGPPREIEDLVTFRI